jgi:hypothetical protein
MTLSLVCLWRILGHSRPPLMVAIRRCRWSTLRMTTTMQRTPPSSHPPLSPYHTGRLSCVFRGGNISGSTLMTTREFWTPSSSNPPHSPLHMQRLLCLFWGGNINRRLPSFCRIVGRITSGQQRTTQLYVVVIGLIAAPVAVIDRARPILRTTRLFPPSLNQCWGGLQRQLQHHLPCRRE